LFLFAFASGVVGTPDSAARQVYALDLVGTDHLTSAISLNEVVLNVSRVVGPALGGALLALEGASACCFVNAASFVPPLIVLFVAAQGERPLPSIARHARTTYSRPSLRVGQPHHSHESFLRRGVGHALQLERASAAARDQGVFISARWFRADDCSVFGVGGIVGGLVAATGGSQPTRRSVGALAAFHRACRYSPRRSLPTSASNTADCSSRGCLSIWFIARANASRALRSRRLNAGARSWVRGRWRYPGASRSRVLSSDSWARRWARVKIRSIRSRV